MKTFKDFVNKKSRDVISQLTTIRKLLVNNGMEVSDFLEEEEPYIFLKNPGNGLPFDGVRIYNIGGGFAYRVQNEDKTHPYGKAYPLSIEEMYQDLIGDDDMNEKKAGKEVIKAITEEMRKFFAQSIEAEKDNRAEEIESQRDPKGRHSLASTTGTDYANQYTTQKQKSN